MLNMGQKERLAILEDAQTMLIKEENAQAMLRVVECVLSMVQR